MKTVALAVTGLAGVASGFAAIALAVTVLGPADSDQFWHRFKVAGVEAAVYGSVAEIQDASSVVVLATIEELSLSRQWVVEEELGDDGIATYVLAKLLPERVLQGSPRLSPDGTVHVELFLPSPQLLGATLEGRPSDRAVFFLKEKTTVPGVYMLTSSQGYLRDAGTVRIPVGAESPWLEELVTTSFEELVDRVAATANE
jgi:hypothetical protein